MIFLVLLKADLNFQESPLNSSTFQACANPVYIVNFYCRAIIILVGMACSILRNQILMKKKSEKLVKFKMLSFCQKKFFLCII